MIGFSDAQLEDISNAAQRVEHGKRNQFLRYVASEITRHRFVTGSTSDVVKDGELRSAIDGALAKLSQHLAA